MASIEVNGGNVVYEILGEEGDFIALTPGGRFSKDIPGLRPLAEALVEGGYRVLLWDRPNCGKSDVQFYGQSESHMRAETLHALITGLDIGPVHHRRRFRRRPRFDADHDALPRDRQQAGGVEHRRRGLRLVRARGHYIVPSILAVRGPGINGLLHVGEWKERIAENPANEDRFLAFDADEFLKVMLRWLNAFVSKPGQTIPGVEDEMFDNITVPTLIIRGGENDWDHPKRTSLEVSCLIKGSTLIDPPWPEDAWERAAEGRAQGKVKHFNMFDTWVQAAPAILKFLDADATTSCECALRSSATPRARCGCGFPGCARGRPCAASRDHVEAVVAGRPDDFPGQTETRQHAVGVVVGAPADVGQHAGDRVGAEGLGAQGDRALVAASASSPADQHLHLTTAGRHRGRDSSSTTSMPSSPTVAEAAMPSLTGRRERAGRVHADTHHRGSHVRKPIRAPGAS